MSARARAFKRLYDARMISIGGVRQAVIDGGLTQEEYKLITGEDYE